MSVSEDSADGAFNWGGAPEIMPSRDKWEGLRRVFARFAALVLHALVLAFFVLGPVWTVPPVEPPVIPIELVLEAPPKKAERPPRTRLEPAPQPQPKASPQPQPDVPHLESGGSPELASGAPAAATATKAAAPPAEAQQEQKPSPAQPAPSEAPAAPAAQAPAPALQPAEPLPPEPPAVALSSAKPPPPKAEKGQAQPAAAAAASANTPPQVASLPPTRAAPRPPAAAPAGPGASELAAPDWSDSERRGEGGGDRYLNALRDAIVDKLSYPASAHGMAGIAKYEIVMNRQGFMLKLAIVQSTGSPALDRAGLDAIENTMPFEPLPLRIVGNRVFILATLYIGPEGTRGP